MSSPKRAGAKSGDNRVTFSMSSAQRIADAVRAVEQGGRDAGAFISSPRIQGVGVPVKLGRFTGSWYIGETHTVVVCNSTNTTKVLNLTKNWWAGEGTATVTGTAIYTKVCGTNIAIELDMDQCKNIGGAINKIASFTSTEIQILGHDANGCLCWYGLATC